MRSRLWQLVNALLAVVLSAMLVAPQPLAAQSSQHLVSPTDLQNAAVDASQSRQKNIDTLNSILSTDQARQAMQSMDANPQEVKKAVAGLSDDELAQLATRANKAQSDFAAGNLGDHDLLIILVCIVALILIIVAVR